MLGAMSTTAHTGATVTHTHKLNTQYSLKKHCSPKSLCKQ